jgi:hypothetical protein
MIVPPAVTTTRRGLRSMVMGWLLSGTLMILDMTMFLWQIDPFAYSGPLDERIEAAVSW